MTTVLTPPLARALDLTGDRAVLDPAWCSFGGPHGGLLAALALRRSEALAGGREPRALTAQLLTALPAGEAATTAELVREGGSSAVVATALFAPDGRPAVTAVVTRGRGRSAGTPYAGVPTPDVPSWQDCEPVALPLEVVPFSAHLEVRAARGMPMSGGPVPELVAWLRFRDDTPLDAAALTVLADALPPALFGATTAPVPVPTVELAVSYASGLDTDPGEGWVLSRIATRTAGDGWCVDDSEVWSPDGRLLVQSRQTRRVLGELVLA